MTGLWDRPTADVLVIMVAFTICFTVLATGAGVLVLTIAYPERDVSNTVQVLAYIINTLLGLLAGFFIGQGRRSRRGP